MPGANHTSDRIRVGPVGPRAGRKVASASILRVARARAPWQPARRLAPDILHAPAYIGGFFAAPLTPGTEQAPVLVSDSSSERIG